MRRRVQTRHMSNCVFLVLISDGRPVQLCIADGQTELTDLWRSCASNWPKIYEGGPAIPGAPYGQEEGGVWLVPTPQDLLRCDPEAQVHGSVQRWAWRLQGGDASSEETERKRDAKKRRGEESRQEEVNCGTSAPRGCTGLVLRFLCRLRWLLCTVVGCWSWERSTGRDCPVFLCWQDALSRAYPTSVKLCMSLNVCVAVRGLCLYLITT